MPAVEDAQKSSLAPLDEAARDQARREAKDLEELAPAGKQHATNENQLVVGDCVFRIPDAVGDDLGRRHLPAEEARSAYLYQVLAVLASVVEGICELFRAHVVKASCQREAHGAEQVALDALADPAVVVRGACLLAAPIVSGTATAPSRRNHTQGTDALMGIDNSGLSA